MNIDSIPHDWLAFLEVLHARGFRDAVIAGGALRDLDSGRPVKDVDIFIGDMDHRASQRLQEAFGTRMYEEFTTEQAEYFANEVSCICTVEYFGVDFQIIAVRDRVTLANACTRNDFGICQIACNGRMAYSTEMYRRDQQNKTFTLLRCCDKRDYERSMKRWERLQQKYPDWTLVVPEGVMTILGLET